MISFGDKELLRDAVLGCGAVAVGFARCEPVDEEVAKAYAGWIAKGNNAGMAYLDRYADIRSNPSLLLENAKTIIVAAFSYNQPRLRNADRGFVARYAYGEDYHDVLRKRLRPVCDLLSDKYSASSRICIDSAPINERYWALRAGIGIKGRNGAVILPSKGSYVFLSELLTSLEVEPDVPSDDTCCGCEKCIKSCPTGALCEDGTIDSRKCINYLTIEHKGAFTDEQLQVLSSSPYRHIYGCEICQEVCPYNQKTPFGEIAEFHLSEQIENLDTESVLKMNEYDFRKMFSKSPVKRAKFEGLKRNVQAYCDIRKR